MKDKIDPKEIQQSAKYVPYLEIVFGHENEVIPVLVLTRAKDLFDLEQAVPVCSGDMLLNVFDGYLRYFR